jgi:TRAP-type C4-dicarboxylate transport system permease small subunit
MLDKFEKVMEVWSNWFNWIALIALMAMVGVVAIDIVGAKIFNAPLSGAVELVSFFGVAIASFSAARTYNVGRHIRVNFIVSRFSVKVQNLLACTVSMVSIVLFSVIIWRTLIYGKDIQDAGEVSLTLNFPYTPFIYGLAVALIPLLLLLVGEFIRSFIEVTKK